MLQVIPTELLGDIIAVVCGEYIDGLIMDSEEAQNPESESSKIARKSEFATDYPDVIGPNALHDNPITALLQVSYQVREITLNTLSKGMSIARQQDGRSLHLSQEWDGGLPDQILSSFYQVICQALECYPGSASAKNANP